MLKQQGRTGARDARRAGLEVVGVEAFRQRLDLAHDAVELRSGAGECAIEFPGNLVAPHPAIRPRLRDKGKNTDLFLALYPVIDGRSALAFHTVLCGP